MKIFAEICLKVESWQNLFTTRFVIFKFKNLVKDFGIPEFELKTFFEPKVIPKTNEPNVLSTLAKNFKKFLNIEK